MHGEESFISGIQEDTIAISQKLLNQTNLSEFQK